MYVTLFNHTLANSYGMGDLYSLVENNEWTVAKLRELSENIYDDLNNEETQNIGDRFGLAVNKLSVDALQYGCELPLLITNEMGELEVNHLLRVDCGIGVVDTLVDLLHTNPGAYVGNVSINIPIIPMR